MVNHEQLSTRLTEKLYELGVDIILVIAEDNNKTLHCSCICKGTDVVKLVIANVDTGSDHKWLLLAERINDLTPTDTLVMLLHEVITYIKGEMETESHMLRMPINLIPFSSIVLTSIFFTFATMLTCSVLLGWYAGQVGLVDFKGVLNAINLFKES